MMATPIQALAKSLSRTAPVAMIAGLVIACAPLNADDVTTMPRVTGLTLDEATQMANVAGVRPVVGQFRIASANWRDDIEADVIYIQSIRAGSVVRPNAYVGLWKFVPADEGAQVVETPDLAGLSLAQAQALLEEQGLGVISAARESIDDLDQATIDGQYPRAGQHVLQGTDVYLQFRAIPETH